MATETLFLKLNTKVKIQREKIYMKDLAKIYCHNSEVMNTVKEMEVYQLQKSDQRKCVIAVLKLIQLIQRKYPELVIDTIGETEVIVEQIKPKAVPAWIDFVKITVVSAVCFFGTVFTIMGFHNDINILDLFERVNEIVKGEKGSGVSSLEIAYSLGLSLGIIIFYNHIGKRKLTQDPTPVAVEMRTYEADVNKSLVELADREGKTIDVS